MEEPIKTYKSNLKNESRNRFEYNEYWADIYFSKYKAIKKEGFGDTNEESQILRLNKFIPGKIYTFKYDPIYKDILSFYDTMPLLFVNNVYHCKNTGNDIVQGVNLNFLPEIIRVKLLNVFYNKFKDEINISEDMVYDNKVNLYQINNILHFFSDFRKVLKLFNGHNKLGYDYAYRSYAMQNIDNLRYVEYQHWEMIPFLNTNKFIGASVEEIYSAYWTSPKNKR